MFKIGETIYIPEKCAHYHYRDGKLITRARCKFYIEPDCIFFGAELSEKVPTEFNEFYIERYDSCKMKKLKLIEVD